MKNGETIPIPKGFYYVGGTVESGVVISDDERDKEVYANIENGDIPSGADEEAYDSEGKIIEENKKIKGNQFVWIPCTLDNYKKINFGLTNTSCDMYTNSSELYQVYKYGGFYVGRFEAGTSEVKLTTANISWENSGSSLDEFASDKVTGKITEKPGEIPYYKANYKTAIDMTKGMYIDNEYVYSGLVTGTMFDRMLSFISNDVLSSNFAGVQNTTWGNYNNTTFQSLKGRFLQGNGSVNRYLGPAALANTYNGIRFGLLTTASTDETKRKNIYDLAGNLWEWTYEACFYGGEVYIIRGGSFMHDCINYPVCFRGFQGATSNVAELGFRPALFIK